MPNPRFEIPVLPMIRALEAFTNIIGLLFDNLGSNPTFQCGNFTLIIVVTMSMSSQQEVRDWKVLDIFIYSNHNIVKFSIGSRPQKFREGPTEREWAYGNLDAEAITC